VARARLSRRKVRQIVRRRPEGFSEREIAQSAGCARSTVQICLWRAEQAGIGWPLPVEQDDAALEARLYPRRQPGVEVHPAPDCAWIERELKRKQVMRRQLWTLRTWRNTGSAYAKGCRCEPRYPAATPTADLHTETGDNVLILLVAGARYCSITH
jgi:hypothetical protein